MMKPSGRKALQPRNIFLTTPTTAGTGFLKPKPLSKENLEVVVGTIDASLAEELGAFKKKLERLRQDRESTERLLKEREGAMDLHMTDLLQRGEAQKHLEIQVDRLFRLKELHAYSSEPTAEEEEEEEEEEESSVVKETEILGERDMAISETGNEYGPPSH